jgi:tetratricopeptide (TPR) repeat protein
MPVAGGLDALSSASPEHLTMRVPPLMLGLLLVGCFTLATAVGPRFEQLHSQRAGGVMGSMLGESRRLFADHFFTRSDVYFHSGYYPSIFDQAAKTKENHLVEGAIGKRPTGNDHDDHEENDSGHDAKGEHEQAGHVHDEKCGHHEHDEHCEHGEEHDFLGQPKDFMDAFSRNFYVSKHTHLTEKGTNAPKEILPWIKLAAQFDPGKVETYTAGAYWLRQMNKHEEAEQFLREGFRHNPQSYDILLELGRGYLAKGDRERARNVLELGLARWREQQNSKPAEQQDRFAVAQILNHLALVEDQSGQKDRAIHWLEIVKKISPQPAEIDKRIAELRAGQSFSVQ